MEISINNSIYRNLKYQLAFKLFNLISSKNFVFKNQTKTNSLNLKKINLFICLKLNVCK